MSEYDWSILEKQYQRQLRDRQDELNYLVGKVEALESEKKELEETNRDLEEANAQQFKQLALTLQTLIDMGSRLQLNATVDDIHDMINRAIEEIKK